MKRYVLYITVIMMTLIAVPTTAFTSESSMKGNDPEPKEIPAEVRAMLDRIDEIKEMDKSGLTRVEKKELRKELREMKKEVKANGYGIYLSAGAIIIILLLIILL